LSCSQGRVSGKSSAAASVSPSPPIQGPHRITPAAMGAISGIRTYAAPAMKIAFVPVPATISRVGPACRPVRAIETRMQFIILCHWEQALLCVYIRKEPSRNGLAVV
jgi:hypothetical protein